MSASRRELLKTIAFSTAVLSTATHSGRALAQQQTSGSEPVEVGSASTAERSLTIVNFDLLEDEARKILPPGRFAFMGAIGDGWTYRENRRAFNDFPIMPRRLQGVSEQ